MRARQTADMRLHIASLPHTQVSLEYEFCAYTMKVRRLAKMMNLQGIPMFLYAGEKTDAETRALVTEDVQVVWPGDRQDWFGVEHWPEDWIFNLYDSAAPHWEETNRRVAQHIAARWEPGDIVGVIAGVCQQSIGRILEQNHGIKAPVVEWGIGYTGVFAPYRVFESYSHRHHVAGLLHDDDYRPQDEVIPNAFDPADFIEREPGDHAGAEGYLLYLGRLTERKGLATVRMLAVDHLTFTAGQGDERIPGAHHLGVVRGAQKAALLRNASAVLVPTVYCEPFGGVSVEAMMAGTPAITTDWGAFTENIPHRYRCATDADFIQAVKEARREDRHELQQRAWAYFGLRPVSERYATYFQRVLDHFGSR
jgi:glycosyltransferase involved in cell wall biosynthesis